MTDTAESATDAAPADDFQLGKLATIAGGHAVHDTFTAFLPPLLPRFVDKFALSNTAAGLLSTMKNWQP